MDAAWLSAEKRNAVQLYFTKAFRSVYDERESLSRACNSRVVRGLPDSGQYGFLAHHQTVAIQSLPVLQDSVLA